MPQAISSNTIAQAIGCAEARGASIGEHASDAPPNVGTSYFAHLIALDGSAFDATKVINFLGGNGDDEVGGSDRNLWGGLGNDLLFGFAGEDRLYSEDGNDTLLANDPDGACGIRGFRGFDVPAFRYTSRKLAFLPSSNPLSSPAPRFTYTH